MKKLNEFITIPTCTKVQQNPIQIDLSFRVEFIFNPDFN